jgi:hypothetical protein
MATTTPNFGWPVPTSTDLVKNGATAIEALGDSIDASLLDLKGGTTGQVLAKNTNTDMDFIWVTDAAGDITGVTAGDGISGGGTSGTVTITNSMATAIEAKGDLVVGTADNTFSRIAVGANDTSLVADSTAATGVAWKTSATLYPWQTWSPSYTRITVGNGTVVARYQQIGKTINFFFKLTWGTTTSVSNYPVFSLPATAFNTVNEFAVGNVTMQDLSAGKFFWGRVNVNSNLAVIQGEYTAGTWNELGVIDSTNPATWASTDIWTVTGTYEVA